MKRILFALLIFPQIVMAQDTLGKLRDCMEYHAFSIESLSESIEEAARVVVRGLCHTEVLAYAAENDIDQQYGLPAMEDELIRKVLALIAEKRMNDNNIELYNHAPSSRWRD